MHASPNADIGNRFIQWQVEGDLTAQFLFERVNLIMIMDT